MLCTEQRTEMVDKRTEETEVAKIRLEKGKLSLASIQPVFPLMAILSHVGAGEKRFLLLFNIFKPSVVLLLLLLLSASHFKTAV